MAAMLNADKILDFVMGNALLQSLIPFLDSGHYWLVGGCLRDILSGRMPDDIDIASDQDPTRAAKRWARQISGRWFWLDRERYQSRVLTPQGETYDFAPLRADSIDADLKLRDFTINAFGYLLQLPGKQSASELLDPANGLADLNAGILRQCHEESFIQDPLRMLKGVRHAVSLDFQIEAYSLATIKDRHALIANVAGERVQAELEAILLSGKVGDGVRLLAQSLLLEPLFSMSMDNVDIESLAVSVDAFADYIRQYQDIDHFGLLLAFLLECVKVVEVQAVAGKRLKLSKKRQQLVAQLLCGEGDVATLPQNPGIEGLSLRQRGLLFERLQPFAFEKLVRSNFTKGHFSIPDTCDLVTAFSSQQSFNKLPHLLSGDEISGLLNTKSGKTIGVLQGGIKAAEMTGEIQNKEDAIEWLKQQNID